MIKPCAVTASILLGNSLVKLLKEVSIFILPLAETVSRAIIIL